MGIRIVIFVDNTNDSVESDGGRVKKKEAHYMERGKYDALDVAKYIVDYVNSSNRKITNLQLQKILYYIQAEFLTKTGVSLFNTPIEAWRHGPVVRSVYFYYSEYANRHIIDFFKSLTEFRDSEKLLMNSVIERLIDIDGWRLVDQTHAESPWKDIYQENVNVEITTDSIKEYFENARK